MSLGFAAKKIFTEKMDFPKIKYNDVQYFNLVHAHNPKTISKHDTPCS